MDLKTHQQIKDKITAKGLKATFQRILIYHTISGMDNHPTAEELYSKIKLENLTISLGTVYKTLDSLVEKELIQKVPTREGKMRYESKIHAHNHIYYVNTNEIVDFEDNTLNKIIKQYLEKKDFYNLDTTNINVSVYVQGNKLDLKLK